MTTVGCPLCDGPVTPDADGKAGCRVGHLYDSEQLNHELTDRATRALWAAITAPGGQGDRFALARLRSRRPVSVSFARRDEIEEQVSVLRNLIPDR